jgi:hypothetical protein
VGPSEFLLVWRGRGLLAEVPPQLILGERECLLAREVNP